MKKKEFNPIGASIAKEMVDECDIELPFKPSIEWWSSVFYFYINEFIRLNPLIEAHKSNRIIQRKVALKIALDFANLMREEREKSYIDPLTGALNRRGLEHNLQRLSRELSTTIESSRIKAYAIFIDVDNFKSFNDKYSYVVGDLVLIKLVESIRANVRKTDLIGRFGGDEFIIIFPATDYTEDTNLDIQARMEQLFSDINEETKINAGGKSIRVTISGSFTEIKDKDLDQIYTRCSHGLHQAKKLGKNRLIIN